MEENLPYITAALFCDRVLEEKDGTLTAVRIIDHVEVELQSNEPVIIHKNIIPIIATTGLICIKSGPVKGKFDINIVGEKPSGKRKLVGTLPVELKGGSEGQNFVLNINIGVDEEGLHWFDVNFGERLLTRIPLMLARKQTQTEKSPEPAKQD